MSNKDDETGTSKIARANADWVRVQEIVATAHAATVVSGKELTVTQTASGQDVIYRQAPHHPLSEAEFNLLVDPPPTTLQWLPTIRGAWLASVVLSAAPPVMAIFNGNRASLSQMPDAGKFGLALTTLIWIILKIVIWAKPDRRKILIEKIRRVWPQ